MKTLPARLRHLTALLLAALAAAPALAHHGTAAVSAIGAEGPGAALDTTSPLPLGQGTVFALAKSEYASFRQRSGFTDQKRYASFNTLAAGYGLRPWLSAFVFQPYNWKAQDGVGTNSGPGDTNLMLSGSVKWDEGLRLTPEKESLDELEDWHFGVWASVSLPLGPTTHRDDAGELYAPDMQTGFNGPSPALGLTALKQLAPDLTLLVEANLQGFFDQRYGSAGLSYRFGAETRVNAALAWRAWASGRSRLDLVPELSVLDLQRDREDGVALRASGGTILYGQLGARATFGALSVGLGVKRALATSLNEAADQQGSEGLEAYRAALVVGYATRL
ncbi:MAG: transporter [Anaeromyxobacter sp.]|nr:transporter [Anaeromyxobacter sp.]MBL0278121.1 transporter [Anaeromyxobacter sp.]